MTERTPLLDKLKNLLPPQFEEVVFCYGLPSNYDKPQQDQTQRAIVLLQYAEQQQALAQVNQLVDKVLHTCSAHLQLTQAIRAQLPPEVVRKPVRLSDSALLRNTDSERLFAEFQRRLEALPAAQQDADLLNALGKLANHIGQFGHAEALFQQAAARQADVGKQAEAHYNTYCAALAQQDLDTAQQAIVQAAQLDAARFEPFPLRKYALQRIIGAGGFGTAFLCHDRHLGVDVVIKAWHHAELDREAPEIFREARVLRALQHPGIIEVEYCDFADAAGRRPYLVMAYFDGVSLTAYVAEHGALSAAAVRALALQLATAMQAAHAQGIWHRDLKPDNILVAQHEGRWKVKIIDFGLALRGQAVKHSVMPKNRGHALVGGSVAGTYAYAAPEQLGTRLGAVGAYSDVYGFGRTLYYALFLQANPSSKKCRSLADKNLEAVLSDCTEEDYRERLADFGAVLDALQRKAEPPPQPLSESPPVSIVLATQDAA